MSKEAGNGTVSIERCHRELEHLSALYESGNLDRKGLELALNDWVLEEVALLRSCKA